MSADISHLLSLPVSEQLEIIEKLWDNIGASKEPTALHPWQQKVLEERRADTRETIDREELWQRVDGK